MDATTIDYLATVGRWMVGLVLLAAGLAKAFDSQAFAREVEAYQILPGAVSRLAGRLLPLAEILVGICLVIGLAVQIVAAIATAMFAIFVIAMGLNLIRGRKLDCYCFGRLHDEQIGFRSIVRSAVLGIVAGNLAVNPDGFLALDSVLWHSHAMSHNTTSARDWLLGSLVLAALYLVGLLLRTAGSLMQTPNRIGGKQS